MEGVGGNAWIKPNNTSWDCFWVFQSFPSYDGEEKCQLAACGFKRNSLWKAFDWLAQQCGLDEVSTMVILLYTGQMLHSK